VKLPATMPLDENGSFFLSPTEYAAGSEENLENSKAVFFRRVVQSR